MLKRVIDFVLEVKVKRWKHINKAIKFQSLFNELQ